MVNSFVISLDMTVMINISQENLKRNKFVLIPSDVSERKKSRNRHYNKPQVNEESFVIPPVK